MQTRDVIDELFSLRDWVRWAASRFNGAQLHFGHGTDNAFDESLALVLFALDLDFNLAEAYLDARLTREERQKVLELIERRICDRMPMAYISGKMRFAGLEFEVDRRVLIPRSPIAELIETHFSPWLNEATAESALDLCTGSGCIALAMAAHLPNLSVDATDISKSALDVARRNALRLQLDDRVTFHSGDLFQGLAGQQYDLIVSNPPYVPSAEYQRLPQEYLHEPRVALQAGDDGLIIVDRILQQSSRFIKEGGILIVEVGSAAQFLLAKYPQVPFLWLDFDHGGDGVFLLTAEQLHDYFPAKAASEEDFSDDT